MSSYICGHRSNLGVPGFSIRISKNFITTNLIGLCWWIFPIPLIARIGPRRFYISPAVFGISIRIWVRGIFIVLILQSLTINP